MIVIILYILSTMSIPTKEWVIDCLKTVFDPEFPLVDIWTMWLIYTIKIEPSSYSLWEGENNRFDKNILWEEKEKGISGEESGERDDEGFISYISEGTITIDMTLTTPACPAADYLPEQAKNSVQIMYPEFDVILNLVWEPTWTIAMIQDDDLKRMFE